MYAAIIAIAYLHCPILMTPDRTKRVKDARSEAQKEIEEYRQKKEEEFKKFETEVCRNQSSPATSCLVLPPINSDHCLDSIPAATRRPRKMPTKRTMSS